MLNFMWQKRWFWIKFQFWCRGQGEWRRRGFIRYGFQFWLRDRWEGRSQDPDFWFRVRWEGPSRGFIRVRWEGPIRVRVRIGFRQLLSRFRCRYRSCHAWIDSSWQDAYEAGKESWRNQGSQIWLALLVTLTPSPPPRQRIGRSSSVRPKVSTCFEALQETGGLQRKNIKFSFKNKYFCMDGLEKIAQKLKMGCTCCVEATGSESLKRKAADCRTFP